MAEFPCLECGKEVRARMFAVSCDLCGCWQHLRCKTNAWQAIRQVFPGNQLMGCVFHWTQAVWRKFQQAGLQETYRQRQTVHSYLRMLLALPFIPSNNIETTFRELEGKANSDQLKEVVRYTRTSWIESSVFPIESWCVFGQSGCTPTTMLRGGITDITTAPGTMLSFYRLVPLLQSEAKLVEIQSRMVAEERGGGRERRRDYARMEEKTQELWAEFRQGNMSTAQLLKGCYRVYAPE